MRLFGECEVVRSHWRGCNAAVIVGPRAITPEESAALLAEWRASFGDTLTPAYHSRDGWQVLDGKGGPAPETPEADVDDLIGDAPAGDPAAGAPAPAPRRGRKG